VIVEGTRVVLGTVVVGAATVVEGSVGGGPVVAGDGMVVEETTGAGIGAGAVVGELVRWDDPQAVAKRATPPRARRCRLIDSLILSRQGVASRKPQIGQCGE
jgi:hypothetical protein